MQLKDKVAIITGGGRGIGRAFCVGYAREGAKVVVADIVAENAINVADEICKSGLDAIPVTVDVSKENETAEMVNKTVEKYGRADILVNNAGIYYGLRHKPVSEWKVEEWEKILKVNVIGIALCVKAILPQFEKQGKGKILNISSDTVPLGYPFLLPYVSSKGAVLAMTRSLARELGDRNICVNGIYPGFVMSEASKELADASAGMVETVVGMQCLKRSQMPEDLVGAAVFLVSDGADFLTGQTISVCGGLVTI